MLIFCAKHGEVANGTTGAMDLLDTYDAHVRAALRARPGEPPPPSNQQTSPPIKYVVGMDQPRSGLEPPPPSEPSEEAVSKALEIYEGPRWKLATDFVADKAGMTAALRAAYAVDFGAPPLPGDTPE